MNNFELEKLINDYLQIDLLQDVMPNGLQVEGKQEVKRIITGVTACQALLEEAVRLQADAVMVHHGYFWKRDTSVLLGMKRQRLKTLLSHDINLYAYHLPIDVHPEVGNNFCLGKMLGVKLDDITTMKERLSLVRCGNYEQAITASQLKDQLESILGRSVFYCGYPNSRNIQRVGWTTGAGQDYIEEALERNVDAFITGEVSERTVHIAREMGIHFYAGGHHATERYGIKALGELLASNYGLDVTFIDIDNPA